MAYIALKSFIGLVNMRKGEIKDIDDQKIAADLVSRGYIEPVKAEKAETKKPAKNKKSEEA